MSVFAGSQTKLTEAEFQQISAFVKTTCGINLHDGKKELVKARLGKRMRMLGTPSFHDYMDYVMADTTGAEVTAMLDVISTNLTYFFREPKHLTYLQEKILPEWTRKGNRRLRIWSAGCSSGEEPYSIAMLLAETLQLKQCDARILATDLSTRVLRCANEGIYREDRFRETSQAMVRKYFTCIQTKPERLYKVSPELRRLIHFARLNLMESWPMSGPFDVIFCRNVMIYFDKETQGRLVNRYFDILAPGGVLFLGHSESLTGIQHRYRYVQPACYQKP
jgi:chemotaxis protein methyltransferase CheR